MMRTLPPGLALIAMLGTSGCASWLLDPLPPPASEPMPPAAPIASETCASWKPNGKIDTPSSDELRAALGKLESTPEVERLMLRLGPFELQRDGGRVTRTYRERGVQLGFRAGPGGNRLERAQLFGRYDDVGGYAGALPDKLGFTQTEAEVEGALGKPLNRYCWIGEGCDYQTLGLSVRSTRRNCLASLTMVRPIGEREIHYEDLEVVGDAVHDGVHGIAIRFYRTAPWMPGYQGSQTTVCFSDDSGASRKWPRWARSDGSDRQERERLCLTASPSDGWGERSHETAFLPYAFLDQAAGPFILKGALTATMATAGSSFGSARSPPIELSPQGDSHFEIPITMPELAHARVAVRRVEVAKQAYDDVDRGRIAAAIATGGASLLIPIPQRWERPDLQWAVYVGGVRAYKSPAAQDVYSATWGTSSKPVPLAPGDALSLCIEDEDGRDESDTIGCFRLTLESYAAQVKAAKPLSDEAVLKLVLGPLLLSKAKPPAARPQ